MKTFEVTFTRTTTETISVTGQAEYEFDAREWAMARILDENMDLEYHWKEKDRRVTVVAVEVLTSQDGELP